MELRREEGDWEKLQCKGTRDGNKNNDLPLKLTAHITTLETILREYGKASQPFIKFRVVLFQERGSVQHSYLCLFTNIISWTIKMQFKDTC